MTPDVLIIGDSHSVALSAGCEQLEISCLTASFSGAIWHDGHISYHDELGIAFSRKWGRKLLDEIRAEIGVEHLAKAGVPVMFSAGFHLGRVVPAFGWSGHKAFRNDVEMPDDRMAVSAGFMREYLCEFRTAQFDLIEGFARHTPVVVVAPPPTDRENFPEFSEATIELMKERGLRVYDPRADFADENGRLPDDLLEADQTHGNARYGQLVVERIIQLGYLKFPCRTSVADL